ncbi:MAG: Stp1/IreP family PP2C-type Ser/Thr phosphatase [Chloroflexia bacterium]|nr:Stp1/IreP family PP2C-type Ser/Thr phosphatase [Chloroflexia bacterium]
MKYCPHCEEYVDPPAECCPLCGGALQEAGSPTRNLEVEVARQVRRPKGDTRPLALQPAFEPLPAGELLNVMDKGQSPEAHYIVKAVLTDQPEAGLHQYRLAPAPWSGVRRRCPHCGSEAGDDEQFCRQCGRLLDESAEVTYLAFEVQDPGRFPVEHKLNRSAKQVPGLIEVVDLLEIRRDFEPFSRHWLILGPPAESRPLIDEPRPFSGERALLLGQQLAEALQELHQMGIALPDLAPEQILLVGEQAKIWRFEGASFPEQVDPAVQQRDILALGRLLSWLVQGNGSLPAVVDGLIQRMLEPADRPYPSMQALLVDLQQAYASLQEPPSLRLEGYGLSHVGQLRKLNEDSLAILEFSSIYEDICRPLGLYIVADGMGGHEGGEIASRLVIEEFTQHFLEVFLLPQTRPGSAPLSDEELVQILEKAIVLANQDVFQERRRRGIDMGTTVVAALVLGLKAYVVHVGDSRCYMLLDELQPLTADHSLVQSLVAIGQLTAQEARTHPQRNVVVRSIGDKPQVVPDSQVVSLQPGARLLLCSDGLNGMLEDDEIAAILQKYPQEHGLACKSLVDAANRAGGHDNITVVIAQLLVDDDNS